jgi:hypothetical protein
MARPPTLLIGGGFQTGRAGWTGSDGALGARTGGRWVLLPRESCAGVPRVPSADPRCEQAVLAGPAR